MLNSRVDHLIISRMVPQQARVLDIGCGDGDLITLLRETRGVDGRGIELDQKNVNICVARGLYVVQGDADTDLNEIPDQAFDVVILSQTIQATEKPKDVLANMLRIGKTAIVSFPNFGHWRVRGQLLYSGRMPVTRQLNATWYESQNIHLCTLLDFMDLCDDVGAKIEALHPLTSTNHVLPRALGTYAANILAAQVVVRLGRG